MRCSGAERKRQKWVGEGRRGQYERTKRVSRRHDREKMTSYDSSVAEKQEAQKRTRDHKWMENKRGARRARDRSPYRTNKKNSHEGEGVI